MMAFLTCLFSGGTLEITRMTGMRYIKRRQACQPHLFHPELAVRHRHAITLGQGRFNLRGYRLMIDRRPGDPGNVPHGIGFKHPCIR